MGTRAVVIDEREEGKGFYVQYDGSPNGLGRQLREFYKEGMKLEELYNLVIKDDIKVWINYLMDTNKDVDFIKVKKDIERGFRMLSEDEIKYFRSKKFNIKDSTISYSFIIRDNGVYMRGCDLFKIQKLTKRNS